MSYLEDTIIIDPATREALWSLMRPRGILTFDAMIRQLIKEAREHVPDSVDQ